VTTNAPRAVPAPHSGMHVTICEGFLSASAPAPHTPAAHLEIYIKRKDVVCSCQTHGHLNAHGGCKPDARVLTTKKPAAAATAHAASTGLTHSVTAAELRCHVWLGPGGSLRASLGRHIHEQRVQPVRRRSMPLQQPQQHGPIPLPTRSAGPEASPSTPAIVHTYELLVQGDVAH
jgi:hypothetical protein